MTELVRAKSAAARWFCQSSCVIHRETIIALAARHTHLQSILTLLRRGRRADVRRCRPRRSASQRGRLVDRVLKGAKPSDLPLQMSIKSYQVINLKTGRAVDITIAPSLFATSDGVIE
jgi:hypothetical protein